MSSKNFLKEYAEESPKVSGIPNIVLNKPFVVNKLAEIGLELEIEGRKLPNTAAIDKIVGKDSKAKWTTKLDGSLRGESLEYVLTTPCYSHEVPDLVNGLYNVMDKMGTTLSLSNRCSTHVHVNANGYRINNLTSVIVLWTVFEELLINYCGEERKTNHFCLSSKDTEALIDGWSLGLEDGKFHRYCNQDGFKYLALNVRPIWDFGSLEFRCMGARKTPQPIIDWALFVHGLCKYANEVYPNPCLISNDLSERSGLCIFLDICERAGVSPSFISDVCSNENNQDFNKLALKGFRRSQKLVMAYPWYEWMEEITKEYVPSPFKNSKHEKIRVNIGADHRIRPDRPDAFRRYLIDPDLPIEFVDGTPAEILNRHEGTLDVRAIIPLMDFNNEGRDLSMAYRYDRATGWWSGDARVGRIRNVDAMPLVEIWDGDERVFREDADAN